MSKAPILINSLVKGGYVNLTELPTYAPSHAFGFSNSIRSHDARLDTHHVDLQDSTFFYSLLLIRSTIQWTLSDSITRITMNLDIFLCDCDVIDCDRKKSSLFLKLLMPLSSNEKRKASELVQGYVPPARLLEPPVRCLSLLRDSGIRRVRLSRRMCGSPPNNARPSVSGGPRFVKMEGSNWKK